MSGDSGPGEDSIPTELAMRMTRSAGRQTDTARSAVGQLVRRGWADSPSFVDECLVIDEDGEQAYTHQVDDEPGPGDSRRLSRTRRGR